MAKRKRTKSKKTTRPPHMAPRAAPPHTPVWDIAPEQQIVGAVFLGKAREDAAPQETVTVLLEAALTAGDTIRVKGHDTDLTQRVEHIEVDGEPVPAASAGDIVSLLVADQVRAGDAVYKI